MEIWRFTHWLSYVIISKKKWWHDIAPNCWIRLLNNDCLDTMSYKEILSTRLTSISIFVATILIASWQTTRPKYRCEYENNFEQLFSKDWFTTDQQLCQCILERPTAIYRMYLYFECHCRVCNTEWRHVMLMPSALLAIVSGNFTYYICCVCRFQAQRGSSNKAWTHFANWEFSKAIKDIKKINSCG